MAARDIGSLLKAVAGVGRTLRTRMVARDQKMLRETQRPAMTDPAGLTPKALARLKHVEGNFLNAHIERTVEAVLTGRGMLSCLLGLSGHCMFGAVYDWFQHGDIETTRNWAWAAGLLRLEWSAVEQEKGAPYAVFMELLYPLISNHRGLIDAFARSEDFLRMHHIDDPGRYEFLLLQAQLAMRGDLPRLLQRAERAIQSGRTPRNKPSFRADYDFLLSLGRQDPDGMKAAIETLLRPRMLLARSWSESGVTESLLSSPAVIYCKLAALNGMPIDIDHPMVPRAWLSDETLARYDFPFPPSIIRRSPASAASPQPN